MVDPRGAVLAFNAVVWTLFVTSVTRGAGFDGIAMLRNFKLEACEEAMLYLKCPENTTISVGSLTLQRGETWKDENNIGCPPLVFDDVHPNTLAEDNVSRCRLSTMQTRMLRTMARLCDNHRLCEVPVSAELLLGKYEGAPCRGHIKRMEVFFKCRPAVYEKTRIVCEDEPFELQCLGRSRVMVVSTTFGRNPLGASVCPQDEGVPEEACDSDSPSMDILTKLCDGRNKCGLIADPVVFADPCEKSSRPFLTIVYACVPEHVLLNAEPIAEEGLQEDEHGNIIDPATKSSVETSTAMSDETTAGSPRPLPTLVLNLEKSAPPENETRRHLYFPTDIMPENYTNNDQTNNLRRHVSPWNDSIYTQLCDTNVTKANHVMGVITEWLTAYQFILKNLEKFVLYLLLSVCVGLLLFCLVLICQLWSSNRRRKRRLLRQQEQHLKNGFPLTTSTPNPPPKPKIKTVVSVGTVTNFPPTSSSVLMETDSEADARDRSTPRFGAISSTPSSGGSLGRPFPTNLSAIDRTPYGSAAVSPSSRAGLLAPLVEIDGVDDFGDDMRYHNVV